ncbi:MAG: chemotaxis protein CheC [Candidatus Altiarchaeota archaeon]|nr:chemotaxis protein CheC [Candidatus Altiarchaeota archaeon]
MSYRKEAVESDSLYGKLTELQLDALQEIATIGMGHATIALSELIDRRVDIEMSGMDLIPLDQIASCVGQKNMLVTGIYVRLRGDLAGTSLLFFSRESALSLVDVLNGREPGTTDVMKSIDRSALGELGSILSASYVNTLAEFLDLEVELSVPSVVFDIASAIVYFVLLSVKESINYSLVSQTEFMCSGGSLRGEFVFLLDDKSIGNILKAIQTKLGSPFGEGLG